MSQKDIDQMSGVETTGHEWDGIKELNNPMPRWWVITFYITIAWAIGYAIAYPSIPLLTGSTQGLLGFHSRGELATELATAKAGQAAFVDKISAMPLKDIVADKALNEFALKGGAAAFKVNCAPCHGSGASGRPGYPNLNDNDWLWGGKLDDIHTTLTHGIRYETDPNTRVSEMPAFGEILKPEEISQVASYVVSLTATPADPSKVAAGKALFATNCAACHGDDAKGKREVGAPNLSDAIWLKGSGEAAVVAQVTKPSHGVMPAWGVRLGDATVKELAIYIHSLGGGE